MRYRQCSIKGRDYYDLLWYLKKGVKPNISRLSEMLGKKIDIQELEHRVTQKVIEATSNKKRYFKADLTPLLMNANSIPMYVDHYLEEYERFKRQSFEKES